MCLYRKYYFGVNKFANMGVKHFIELSAVRDMERPLEADNPQFDGDVRYRIENDPGRWRQPYCAVETP